MDVQVPVESIVDLARVLVALPSQAGVDSTDPVIEAIAGWWTAAGVPHRLLRDEAGRRVAVTATAGPTGEPGWCFDACVDTAPAGDPGAWSHAPFSADVEAGWLWGRGSADSKAAVAIFAHLARHWTTRAATLRRPLLFLFDADEHTGGFAGARAFLREGPALAGVAVGYPGMRNLVVGARGFWRAEIEVFGTSVHSGSSWRAGENAVVKASRLVGALDALRLPDEPDEHFAFGPKLTVTRIAGGAGWSVVPDRCLVHVDARLTPAFGAGPARALLEAAVTDLDRAMPTRRPTSLHEVDTWPPYRVAPDSPIAAAIASAAEAVTGGPIPRVVCGPSNIGNLLAAHGVPTVCGFGVRYENLHAPDERIEIASIVPVYETYARAMERLGAG